MTDFPTSHGLALAAILFSIGLGGILFRRNIVFVLMSIEILLNASGLAFLVGSAKWGDPDGQVMFFFILAMAAAEVAVGLALVIQLDRQFGTLDSDATSEMKG